ncbi:MAG: hypothetical protein IJF26_05830 [Clostridia bacterium]|nr:hypothetical protein [Clostridia bacterium]
MKIPIDVEKTASAKRGAKIEKWALSTLILGALLLMFGNDAFASVNPTVRIVVYILLLLIPAIVTRIPLVIFDRSWQGTIIKVHSEMGAYSDERFIARMNDFRTKLKIEADIKLTDGRVVRKTVYLGKPDAKIYEKISVGDTVYHVKGAKYLQHVSSSHRTATCVICGKENSLKNQRCDICDHSLLIK